MQNGKLGDSFPQSSRYFDFRGRWHSAPTLSSLIQALGRICHYRRGSPPIPIVSNYLKHDCLDQWNENNQLYRFFREPLRMRPDTYLSELKIPLMPEEFLKKYKHQTELQIRCRYQPVHLKKSKMKNCDHLPHLYRNYNEQDRHRLVLSAQPQMGKTGVIIEFLFSLHERITQLVVEDKEVDQCVEIEDPSPVFVQQPAAFSLPYGRYFEGRLSDRELRLRYQLLRWAKYHMPVVRQRLAAISNSQASNLESFIRKDEGITSATAQSLLMSAIEKYQRDGDSFSIVK